MEVTKVTFWFEPKPPWFPKPDQVVSVPKPNQSAIVRRKSDMCIAVTVMLFWEQRVVSFRYEDVLVQNTV